MLLSLPSPSLSRDSPLPFLSLFIQSNPDSGGGVGGVGRADIDRKGEERGRRGLPRHRHRHPKRAATTASHRTAGSALDAKGEIEISQVGRADWRRRDGSAFNLPSFELLSLSPPPRPLFLSSPGSGLKSSKNFSRGDGERRGGGARGSLPATDASEGESGGAKTAGKLFQSRSATIYKTMSYISLSSAALTE